MSFLFRFFNFVSIHVFVSIHIVIYYIKMSIYKIILFNLSDFGKIILKKNIYSLVSLSSL